MQDALALLPAKLSETAISSGQGDVPHATACVACHRFGEEGSSGVGPDLTGAGGRYSVRDLLENIIEPSLVIAISSAPSKSSAPTATARGPRGRRGRPATCC